MNEKKVLNDAVVGIDGRLVEADRKVCKGEVTYEPHGTSGSHLDTNALVYELMLIAGCDMIEVGCAVFSGDYTAVEMAGTVSLLHQFVVADDDRYDLIRIKTATFSCQFYPGDVFEQIAEWEGVAGITNAKAYKFHCEGKEMPKGAVLKKYQRCHGYKPTRISFATNERYINEKFNVLGQLYVSLTSEGMRKALSLLTAIKSIGKLYGMDAEKKAWDLLLAFHWKRYQRKPVVYQKLVAGKLVEAQYPEHIYAPFRFRASDFQYGPECYKVVDDDYVRELLQHFRLEVGVKPKATTDSADKTDKPKAISPQTSVADKLREALMARLSA